MRIDTPLHFFNKILETTPGWYACLVCLSAISVVVFGTYIGAWYGYFYGATIIFWDQIVGVDPYQAFLATKTNWFREATFAALKFVLDDYWTYLTLATLLRVLVVIALAMFLRSSGMPVPLVFAIAVLCVQGDPSGGSDKGLSEAALFKVNVLSIPLAFLGLHFLTLSRFIIGGALIGMATWFHPFNGLCVAGLSFCYLCLNDVRESAFWRRILIFTASFSLVVLPLVLSVMPGLERGEYFLDGIDKFPFQDWFLYSANRDANDRLMAFSFLTRNLYTFAPAVGLWLLTRQPGPRNTLEKWFLAGLVFSVGNMLVEALHFHGLYIPLISDVTATYHPRRALIFVHVALMGLSIWSALSALSREDEKADNRSRLERLLIFSITILVCYFFVRANIITWVGAMALCFLAAAMQKRFAPIVWPLFLVLGCLAIRPLYPVDFSSDYATELWADRLISTRSILVGPVLLVSVALFHWLTPNSRPVNSVASGGFVITSVFSALLVSSMAYNAMVPGRTFSGILTDIRQFARVNLDPGAALTGPQLLSVLETKDENAEAEAAAFTFIVKRAPSPVTVLFPPTFRHPLPYYPLGAYLYEETDRVAFTSDRRYATEYDRRLKALYGKGLEWFYKDPEGQDVALLAAFKKLTMTEVLRIAEHEKISYAVLFNNSELCAPVLSAKGVHVFDLNACRQ